MHTIKFEKPETPGLVSVVMPTLNGERFIGEALDSIARQEYANWEVIVVDDGSEDGTASIVREFAARVGVDRVRYHRNEAPTGPSAARNTAFAMASGEWLAFLDCDDRWLPTHLSACVEAFREPGNDIVYSTAVMVEDGSDRLLGMWGPNPGEDEAIPQSLFGRNFITPSATAVRRSVIAAVGPWNTRCRYGEDAEFFLRAAQAGAGFRSIGGVHCLYRKNHDDAATRNLAATIESYATITSWFIGMPNTRRGVCTRSVAQSFICAAKMHLTHASKDDPSAVRSRAAPLYLAAWRMRPKRIGCLLKAARYALFYGWSTNPNLPKRHESPAFSGAPSGGGRAGAQRRASAIAAAA